MPVPRRISREAAFQTLYSLNLTGDNFSLVRERLASMVEIPESEDILTHRLEAFGSRILEAFLENRDQVEETLENSLDKWDPDRLTKTDGALLRLGITELLYLTDVPPKVVINEYIELAKRYGDKESPSFINGILDKVHRANSPT